MRKCLFFLLALSPFLQRLSLFFSGLLLAADMGSYLLIFLLDMV